MQINCNYIIARSDNLQVNFFLNATYLQLYYCKEQ